MRSLSRLIGISINTVTKLLLGGGTACAAHHDEHVRGVTGSRIHKAHRMSPAMVAGATGTLRDTEWIAGPVEAAAPKPVPRGPYKKRAGVPC